MATRRRICRIRVLAKMVILENWSDSIHSPTLATLLCPDSIHLPGIRQPFSPDSIHSRKANLATFTRIQRIWRIQRVQTRPFYTYKKCYLGIKRPILLAPTFANLFWSDSIHLPDIRQPFSPDSIHSPDIRQPFPRTRYISSHSTFAIFEKNVTCLDLFARVIRHFGEFGASGHCLRKSQKFLQKCHFF